MVGAIVIGLIAVYEARTLLDVQAQLYTANALEARSTSAIANPAPVTSDQGAVTSPQAAVTSPDQQVTSLDRQREVTGSIDARGSADDEQLGKILGTEPGEQRDARFVTIYIRRGVGRPEAYVVPRE